MAQKSLKIVLKVKNFPIIFYIHFFVTVNNVSSTILWSSSGGYRNDGIHETKIYKQNKDKQNIDVHKAKIRKERKF